MKLEFSAFDKSLLHVWIIFILLTLCFSAVGFLVFIIDRDLATELAVEDLKELSSQKRILITGAAGFIGFHLAKKLSIDKSNFVVGIDNFNDYYDVRLKIDRSFQLSKLDVIIYKDDLCNDQFLSDVMSTYNFTHVIHLAAQAGVRYSMEDPLAYVTANYECFLVLLESLKQFKGTRLIYASSSSVYGKTSEVPFGHLSNTKVPGNMYAATKKANELLSLLYCKMYNVSSVGLRLFTVYGPWGRPDMAIFMFVQLIHDGNEIPLYQASDGETLSRDFTYIDDIIAGIELAIDYQPIGCGETFNLGFGHPVKVDTMVKIIEKELGIKAKIKRLPLPVTEILQTWANISESTTRLRFDPTTSIASGIRKFIEWHNSYITQSESSASKRIWFRGLERERLKRLRKYREQSRGEATKRNQ